jgi:DNA-binding transcriptional ArsR family regulator
MALTRRRVTDAVALKALAHPVRLALLSALVTRGPMTATQAGALLEESPSNCSWHLRKLAEHGFVRETRGATGRNRPWQAVGEGLEWDESTADPTERLAAEALTDMLVEREMQRFRAARAAREREPEAWREATGLLHASVWLTAQEARAAKAEIEAVLVRHAHRSREPDQRPDGARLTSLVAWSVPSGPYAAPVDAPV